MKDCGTILVVDPTTLQPDGGPGRRPARLRGTPAPTGDELLERLGRDRPALAIVEVELPGPVNGLEVMRQLHESSATISPSSSSRRERTDAFDRAAGFMLGADDYLSKPLDGGELLARVKRSLRRSAPFANGNGTRTSDESNLSPREREILALLAEGRTQGQIATVLVISSKTVATHIQHILSKLGVNTRAQAVAMAFQRGLVEPDVRAHLLAELEPV